MTLLGLAAIYEGMRKKPTHEIIVLLQRAHQIFLAIDGPKGVRTQQTLEHIKRLQQPETADSGGLSSRVKPVDDMDEDGVKIVSEISRHDHLPVEETASTTSSRMCWILTMVPRECARRHITMNRRSFMLRKC